MGGRDRVAQRQHQPVGTGVEDKAHLIGDCALAGGPIRGHLDLVHLDEVLGLSPLAVDVLVEMLGLPGQGGHDVAGVEAQCGRLEPGDDPALDCPACRRVAGFLEAAQLGSALLGPQDLERVSRLLDLAAQDAVPSKAEDVVDSIGFAPRHRLRAAIVGIAPEGDAGRWPMHA